MFVASGDVDGDGFDDIITAAGAGGGPHVRAFSGHNLAVLYDFFAFDGSFTGGVHVAAADVAGNETTPRDEIIAGTGAGILTEVRVFGDIGGGFTQLASVQPYPFGGGVYVGALDDNGDGKSEIITGAGAGGAPHVVIYDYNNGSPTVRSQLHAYDSQFSGGVRVAGADIQGDGVGELMTAPGPGGNLATRVFDVANPNAISEVYARFTHGSFAGGLFVGAEASDAGRDVHDAPILDDGMPKPNFQLTAGTWTTATDAGFGGDLRYIGAAGGVARWQFSNLAPGTYRVATTWAEGSNRSDSVSYTITNAIGGGGSVVNVNQKNAPDDFSDAGAMWEILDSAWQVTGNTLIVELASGATETTIADAVRIELIETFNEAPIIDSASGPYFAAVGVPLNFTVTTQPDEDNVVFTLVDPPEGATIDPATGEVTWTPPASANGSTVAITVMASDSGSPPLSDTESFTVNVIVNAPPVLEVIGNQNIDEQQTLVFRADASDPDELGSLSYGIEWHDPAGMPEDVYFDTKTGLFVWAPDEEHGGGTYSVTITATDNSAVPLSDSETITLTVDETNLRPTIYGPPDVPIEGAYLVDFSDGGPTQYTLNFTISADDNDTPGQVLTFSADMTSTTNQPVINQTSNTEATVTWVIDEGDAVATHNLTLRITDNGSPARSDTEVVRVNVSDSRLVPSSAPIANPDFYQEQHGVQIIDNTFGVLYWDWQIQGTPEVVVGAGPTNGTLSLDPATGYFTYTPNSGFAGYDSFTYTITDTFDDGNGGTLSNSSNSTTVELHVTNDDPYAFDDFYQLVEGNNLSVGAVGVLGNDSDNELDAMTVALASGTANGMLNLSTDGSFTYEPNAGFTGYDAFAYEIDDDLTYYPTADFEASFHDDRQRYGVVTIYVQPNAAPVANNDAYDYSILDGEVLEIEASGVLGNDSDDGLVAPLTSVLVTDAAHGTVSLAADGGFIYTRDAGFVGQDSFTYQADDGRKLSNVATVTIDVSGPYELPEPTPTGQPTTDNPLGGTCNCGCGFGVQAHPDKQTGGLDLSVPAGDQTLNLLTNANPHPIIAVNAVFSADNTLVPDAVEASLTFGGVTGQTVYYSTVGMSPGDELRFPLQVNATSLSTGRYEYTLTLTNFYGTQEIEQTFRGYQNVVNLTQSEFGNRWSLAGLDRLVIQSGSSGALLVRGDGRALWYESAGNGQFAASAGDPEFASLVQNTDGSYTMTSKDGSRREFDSTGLLTSRVDANANVTDYNYVDGDGDIIEDEISEIVDPFGRKSSFAYSGGRLTSVTDKAGRMTTIVHNPDGTLAAITAPDPDGIGQLAAPVQNFGYDTTTKLLTSWTNALSQTTQFMHDNALRLSEMHHPDGEIDLLDPVQTQGWVDTASGGGTASNPAPLFYTSAAAGSETHHGHTSSFTTDRFGYLTKYIDAHGSEFLYERDANGLATRIVQPDPDDFGPLGELVTEHTYDAFGNMTLTVLPSLATQSWTYESTFNRMTSFTDEMGRVTLYAIDPANGNLLSETRVVGEVDSPLNGETDDVKTSYTYTDGSTALPAGLMLTEIDPLGRVTAYAYYSDPLSLQFGRLQSMTYAQGTTDQAVWQYEYDAAGNRTAEIDPMSSRTDYEYDALDRLIKTMLPDPDDGGQLGRPETQTSYDAEGNVLTQTDALGRITQFEYEFGRLVKRTDPDPDGADPLASPVTSYTYVDGRLATVTDPLNRVTSYGYDDLDRLTTTTLPDPDGAGLLDSPVYTTAYDLLGNVISQTDPLNNMTEYAYDELSRAVTITDALSGTTSFAYNAAGETTSSTDALGRTTNYDYDDLGRLITTTLPDPDDTVPLGRPVYTTHYDKVGNITSEIDPLNNLTNYEYDALNRRITVTAADPDGTTGLLASPVYRTTYDTLGNVLTETDPLLRVTSYEYDNLSRLIKTTLADPDDGGQLVSPMYQTAYDAVGNVTSQTDPLTGVTSYEYDRLNRLLKTTQADPDGGGMLASPVMTYVYDAAGQVTHATDPLNRLTQYEYDDLGRQTKRIEPDPDGGGLLASPEHLTAYDAVGNVTSQTDPLGKMTGYGYDELYRRTSITDALLGVTTFDFDAVGNLLSLTDPELYSTTWDYDRLNRVITETNALLASRSFSYNAVGNLTQRTDRNERVTKYFYDNLHRRTQEQWLDGQTVVRTISSTYDAASQLTEISDPSASYSYDYDRLGRTTEIEQQLAGLTPTIVMAQEFDELSRRTSMSAEIGTLLDFANGYQYDALSRLTKITQQSQTGGNAVAGKRVDLAYNSAGQFTGITRYHDLAGMQTVVSTAYAYDPLGRLTDLTHSQGATTLADYGWTYDAFSRITSFTSLADGTSNYSYDDTNQLTTADHSSQTDENYSYDANGNRTNGDYSTGTNNQLVSDGTYNYTYDDEGNRLTQTTIATGEAKEYEWDYRNRLVGITYLTAAGGTTTKRVAYDYDAFDRRIAKHVDDTGGGTFNRGERYVYDGEHVALVFDHTGALLNRFLHNPQVIDQILADEQFEPAMAGEMPTAPGNVIWPLADNLGTIRDLAEYDDTLGITDIVNHRVYDSFGEIISETDPTVDHQFGFTGRDWGSDAGLYYYRARWYDARVGRFVSEDPIGFDADDRNLSRYVGNNPTTATDPSGHELQPAVFLYPAEGARGFGWNELNRVVTMIVYVHFKAAEGDPDIDQKVLDDFGKKVENFTEKTFNANAVWIVPSAPPCVRWKPRLNVVLTDNPRGIDITVASVHDQSGTNSDDPNNITGNWDTLDVTFREGQYSAVHEMGHVIGLRHPGKDNGYDADPSALMGYGMQLRTVYFHSWAERLNRVEPAQAPWIPLGPPAPAPIPDRPRRYP